MNQLTVNPIESAVDIYSHTSDLFDLNGKSFVIFGGSSGIGLGMAIGLGSVGAKIHIVGRNKSKLDSANELLRTQSINNQIHQGDIMDPSILEQLDIAIADDKKYAFSGIILSAAAVHFQDSILYENTFVDKLIDTNLKSQFSIAQWAARHFKAGQGGTILFISSMASKKGMKRNPIYAATKGAVNSLAKTLAIEWAKYNIRVNTIIPGWVDTPMTQFTKEDQDTDVYEKIRRTIPTKRWGQPRDFAGVVILLMSKAGNYISGTELIVDGGLSSV